MSKTKQSSSLSILAWMYLPVAIICAVLLCWLMYYEIYLKNTTIAFQSAFVDEATYAEDKYFMEVQVFDDVLEVKVNYYVDTNLPTQNEDGSYDDKYIMSTGVQFYDTPISTSTINTTGAVFYDTATRVYELQNCTYYTQPDGLDSAYISGEAGLANQDAWIWDISGQLCAIKERGAVFLEKCWWCSLYDSYDMSRLIAENYESFLSFREGTTITLFDFSRYFDLYTTDSNGHFTNPVQDENILEEWTYVTVKVTKTNHKMLSAKQSLFGSYRGDSEWSADGSEYTQNYWTDETVYQITADDFTFSYDANGYSIEVKKTCLSYLSEFNNLVVDININLDDFGIINVIGFTEQPFGDLKVNSISISSNEARQFIVYDSTLNIQTENVEIVYGGEAC